MIDDPAGHRRRSIRLKGYDYAQPGAYFVTICTQDRACLFGNVIDGVMNPNSIGRLVARLWSDVPVRLPGVELDMFVVMPHHIHGIILFSDGAADKNMIHATLVAPLVGARTNRPGAEDRRATTRVALTVGNVVGAFNSSCTV